MTGFGPIWSDLGPGDDGAGHPRARAPLSARMLLQVHDELLFQVPEAELDKTAEVVKEVMGNACAPALELTVPLVADVGTGPNWAEAH